MYTRCPGRLVLSEERSLTCFKGQHTFAFACGAVLLLGVSLCFPGSGTVLLAVLHRRGVLQREK